MRNTLILLLISIALTGCLIPLDGSEVTATNQAFTIYTFKPNQRVQLQCAEWFWYAGHEQDPRWDERYRIGWKTMATGRTGTTPINPEQTSKVYSATMTADPGDFKATFNNFRGCYGLLEDGDLEIRPRVDNGGWKNWIVFDDAGKACMQDDARHDDDEDDPKWGKRANTCKTGGSGFYSIK